jgi:hypothetical protein
MLKIESKWSFVFSKSLNVVTFEFWANLMEQSYGGVGLVFLSSNMKFRKSIIANNGEFFWGSLSFLRWKEAELDFYISLCHLFLHASYPKRERGKNTLEEDSANTPTQQVNIVLPCICINFLNSQK